MYEKLSLQTAQIWANDMQKFLCEIDPDTFWLPDIPIVVVDDTTYANIGISYNKRFIIIINLNKIKDALCNFFIDIPFFRVIYGKYVEATKDYLFNIIIHEMLHIHQYLPHHTKYMNRKRKLAHDMLFYEDDVRYMTLQFIIKNFGLIKMKYPSYKGADLHPPIVIATYNLENVEYQKIFFYKEIMRKKVFIPIMDMSQLIKEDLF